MKWPTLPELNWKVMLTRTLAELASLVRASRRIARAVGLSLRNVASPAA